MVPVPVPTLARQKVTVPTVLVPVPVLVPQHYFLLKNLSLSSQKDGFGDPGSGKTYSESRIQVQGSKRHRIPDPDSQHFIYERPSAVTLC
jgi:hypothetical protein